MGGADAMTNTFGEHPRAAAFELEALQVENLHLRQLVGELLLKNQRLREASLLGTIANSSPFVSA